MSARSTASMSRRVTPPFAPDVVSGVAFIFWIQASSKVWGARARARSPQRGPAKLSHRTMHLLPERARAREQEVSAAQEPRAASRLVRARREQRRAGPSAQARALEASQAKVRERQELPRVPRLARARVPRVPVREPEPAQRRERWGPRRRRSLLPETSYWGSRVSRLDRARAKCPP